MHQFYSIGELWKRYRSNASRQVVPRRVANFVEPLCVIAEGLLSHLETLQDEDGNVQDITPEMYKWAFQGKHADSSNRIFSAGGSRFFFVAIGVSYLVYGEKIDTFSTSDPEHHDFIEAATHFLQSFPAVMSGPILVKMFPSRRYRDYMKAAKKMHQLGKKMEVFTIFAQQTLAVGAIVVKQQLVASYWFIQTLL